MTVKIYTARQPIFNRKKQVVAYELLFRDSNKNCFPTNVPDGVATSKLLVNTLLNMDIDDVTEGLPALINFPESIIKSKFSDLVPSKKIIIEILESVTPDDETYEWVRGLFHRGYYIALDDFVFKPEWERFFKFVKLIKIDIRQTNISEFSSLIPRLKQENIKVLAEKVETYEELKTCMNAGFDYFQGFFFCKPEMIHATGSSVSHHLLVQIYHEVMRENPDLKRIKELFSQEPRLSYKLLRFVKKTSGKDISSINQGVSYLGIDNLRKLTSLLMAAEINPSKPHALVKTSVVRSRFCELLAANSKHSAMKDEAFLTGLFSTMDAILDRDMSTVLEGLPLKKEVREALLDNSANDLGQILSLVKSYEQGDFQIVNLLARVLKISQEHIPTAYKKAMKWETQISSDDEKTEDKGQLDIAV